MVTLTDVNELINHYRLDVNIVKLYNFLVGVKSVDEKLEYANKVLEGHGVEAVHSEDAEPQDRHFYYDIAALYVNMGDTYNPTVLYDTEEDEFMITTWGDWYEEWERRKEGREENHGREENRCKNTMTNKMIISIRVWQYNILRYFMNESEGKECYKEADGSDEFVVMEMSPNQAKGLMRLIKHDLKEVEEMPGDLDFDDKEIEKGDVVDALSDVLEILEYKLDEYEKKTTEPFESPSRTWRLT